MGITSEQNYVHVRKLIWGKHSTFQCDDNISNTKESNAMEYGLNSDHDHKKVNNGCKMQYANSYADSDHHTIYKINNIYNHRITTKEVESNNKRSRFRHM